MTDCCISFDSYIKPQPSLIGLSLRVVVYLLIPTSNHNLILVTSWLMLLYIFWFLHQTTTWREESSNRGSCISFDSYIKPQLAGRAALAVGVVYLLIPTSNHNGWDQRWNRWKVVYLLIPTSNHNLPFLLLAKIRLYIFWFLHQTTTNYVSSYVNQCCISFDSYIKPQLWATPSAWRYRLYIFWFLHQTTTKRK